MGRSAIISEKHLEADEEAVQRVLVQLIGATEQVVEQRVVALDVAHQQRLREVALVFEMIEEAALGDTDGGDQLVDRGGGEALFEHRRLGRVENALARVAALPLLRARMLSSPRAHCTTGTVDPGIMHGRLVISHIGRISEVSRDAFGYAAHHESASISASRVAFSG